MLNIKLSDWHDPTPDQHFDLQAPYMPLVNALTNITDACAKGNCKFQNAEEVTNSIVDCINIFTHDDDPDNYYAVYHRIDWDLDDYVLYFGISKDL